MSKICSLVVLYKGEELSQEAHDAICMVLVSRGIIESTDDVQIRYYDGESIADTILANEHKENNNEETELHFVVGPSKIKAVKLFKDELGISLEQAKDIVDKGFVRIKRINYPIMLKNLCRVGAHAVDLSDEYALMQAVIYINERYPKPEAYKNFLSAFIKDVLDADSNPTDDFSVALIEAIKLIANSSSKECEKYGLDKTIYGNICVAYNLLASM